MNILAILAFLLTILLPRPMSKGQEIIVKHKAYTLSYNKSRNTPNWVAWTLTAAHADGPVPRARKFLADPQIPRPYRVEYYDYTESGYDRGHRCPAADNKWDVQAMRECFYMSNMCPQDPSLNSGAWASLEKVCREWAKTEGEIHIVCGPVYKKKKHERIGIDHVVEVPDGFFKAVLSLRKGHEKAIAFYYVNDSRKQQYRHVCTAVDNIEALTGLDLFASLDDALEARLERRCNINDWK